MKITVQKKLLGGFLIVLVFLGIVGGMGSYELTNVNESYEELLEDRVTKLAAAKDMKQEMTNQALHVRGFVISNDEEYITKYEESVQEFEKMLQALKTTTYSEKGKDIVQRIENINNEYQKIIQQALELKKNGDENGYLQIMSSSAPAVNAEFMKSLQELETFQFDNMAQGREAASQLVANVIFTSFIILIVALLVSLGVALWISRQISKPILTLVSSMKQVASGDLSVQEVKIKSRDELRDLGAAFNQMVRDLRPIVSDVRDSSTQVAASSEQLNASAEESSSASEEIAQLIQQSAEGMEQQLHYFNNVQTSMEEIAVRMEKMNVSSEDMLHSTESANSMTKDGSAAVQKVFEQMNKINNSALSTTDVIRSLGERSKEIHDIVSFITDISAQTNLLALNAAIEAARAGEHGKGFAVVANEVRKLAEESRKSAEQITQMITMIQEETHQAVLSMEQQNKEVEEGLSFTDEANGAFTEIEVSVGQVTNKVKEMSSSIKELDALSEKIVKALENVKQIAEASVAASQQVSAGTEENVAVIEEVSANAQNLAMLAENLQKSVSRFKLD
ncbi:hypothetical protein BTO30_09675 [Domibacillus antri]|uniref:Methyl-accepting chemotaxis protein n=1 Tax=Domibacillus antri TaxID=1714264 RepID=A0A1Q8Q4Z1_9BACI|nr:methyl-accepting chemotaxis protein [Domibacillus antri]OLN22409.1 hypothetical protein BTO30_09675 [Domibacillus antri]